MARLKLTLFGGFQARRASGEPVAIPGKKAQALLAYLALRPGQPQPRPKLAALLWGDRGEAQAQDSLRQTLMALRRALPASPPPCLLIERATVALNPTAVEVDVAAFERGTAEATLKALGQATALYQGDLLEGLDVQEAPFEEWLRAERERLRERAREALTQLLEQQSQGGAIEPAIQTAGRLLSLDPVQESVHRTLMRLYIRQGRPPLALRQYRLCVSALQRELGVEPEAETRQLYQAILQQRTPRASAPDAPARRLERPEIRARLAPREHDAALVGRDSELTALRQAMAAAWAGQGRVVTLVGEAGIGKTRLVQELAAEAVERGGQVVLGRAHDLEQILPFRPWVDALRGVQALWGDGTLDGLGPAWRAELAWLFPELVEPGTRLPAASQEHVQLFEAVTRLIEQLGARHPLLVVLEDLHWADEMSLRLLAFVARRLLTQPLLLVASMREEELPSAPFLGRLFEDLGREPGFTRLALPPLSQPDTARLVHALASRAGGEETALAQLADRIWRASEGNPLMVVETFRALQQGIPADTPGALPFPDRVRQVIAGRLDRLPPRARDLLAVAAVIGREFELPFLQHAAGLSAGETAAGLEELVRRRVVHSVGDRFDVSHDRIREVAYARVLPPRRSVLHSDVARAMETLHAGDLESHAASLGRHYGEAQSWDKAVDYLRRAGAMAMARSAHREAVTSYERALEALAHLPESREAMEEAIDLRLDVRGPLWQLGELDRLRERLCEAEPLARALGDQRRLGWLSYYLSGYFEVTAQYEQATVHAQRILEICTAIEEPPLLLRGRFCLARIHYALGDYRRAADLARQNLEALEDGSLRFPGGTARLSVMSRWVLALSLTELGEFTEAVACAEEAVRITDTVDHSHCSVQHASQGLGFVYAHKGDFRAAISPLERAFGLSRSSEAPLWFPGTASPLGLAYSLTGRRAEALPMLEEAASKLEIPVFLPLFGAAYLHAGRADEAYRFARRALEVSRANRQRGCEAYAHWLFGEIALHRDPLDAQAPERHFRQALALAGELGMRPLNAHCHLGLGKLYRWTGDEVKVREHLTAATTLYGEMGMDFWLAETEPAIIHRSSARVGLAGLPGPARQRRPPRIE
jgi:DNA-binding SARP family transcriptional activator